VPFETFESSKGQGYATDTGLFMVEISINIQIYTNVLIAQTRD
jgi:hypothetical protein